MTVVSSALLCHVSVSRSQLASDKLLELVLLHLVSPLQVKVQQHDKAELSMTLSDQVLTQRNVILKTLVGLIGVKGRSLSHPTTPISSAALTAWMSVADSIRTKTHPADDLMANLNSHLETHAFLLPTSHTASLADLDLVIELLAQGNHDDPLDSLRAYPHIWRWISTCHAMLVSLGCQGVELPAATSVKAVTPVFFRGDEDATMVYKSPSKSSHPSSKAAAAANQPRGKKQQQAQPTRDAGKDNLATATTKKKSKATQQQPPPADAAATTDFTVAALDIRVGTILKAWHHPDAEKLFCEEIDVGNGDVRQIASGLRPFYQTDDLVGRSVVVLCNLKKRNLVGFASHGMVLCASNADHTQVTFVVPPPNAQAGDRVIFGELSGGEPEAESKVAKKKIFEKIAPDLKTTDTGKVVWKELEATVAGAPVTAELKGAHVS